MPSSGVARRYAQAVFDIALEDNNLDGWARDLQTIQRLLGDPTTQAYLNDPSIATEAKLQLVDSGTTDLGVKPRNLVRVLIEGGRTAILDDVVATYQAELDRARGIVHATVTTAVALSEPDAAAVAQRLEAITGKRVILTRSVDPAILGGFVARIGDRLIDASVVERLNALRESLMA